MKTKNVVLVPLIILIALLLLALFNRFDEKLNSYIEQNTYSYLEETSSNNIINFNSKLSGQYQALKATAICLSKFRELDYSSNEEMIMEVLQSFVEQNSFVRLGLIDKDGFGISNEGKISYNLSELEFFKRAMNGETNITKLERSPIDGKEVFVIATPVYKDGEINSVLTAAYNQNTVSDIFGISILGKSGYKYIVDESGKILICNDDCKIGNIQNLFDYYKKSDFEKGNGFDEIKAKIGKGEGGISRYTSQKGENLVSYKPIGINGWYMFSVVPEEVVVSQTRFIANEAMQLFVAILLCFLILIIYIVYSSRRYNEKILLKTRELEILTDNIPGGVIRTKIDSNLTITYANEEFLNLVGYTWDEYRDELDFSARDIIHPHDIDEIMQNVKSRIGTGKSINLEYRLVNRNNEIIWAILKGRILKNERGEDEGFWVIVENNKEKLAREALIISEQKYKILVNQSDSLIFEYDIETKKILYSENFNKFFDRDSIKSQLSNELFLSDIVFEADRKKLDELFSMAIETNKNQSVEIRIKSKGESYIWCLIRTSTICDIENNPITLIGKITNIDQRKRETEKLRLQTKLDSLTELYNKKATRVLIEEFLEQDSDGKMHAMLAVDIDDFKSINDNLGHLFGDAVIIEIAGKLKMIFNDNAIIGRFGGDEFIVFLKNVPSEEFVLSKAKALSDAFRHSFTKNGKDYKISGSIGIAIYDKHGRTFDSLYKKADIALYHAKNEGKDKYFIYSEGSMGHTLLEEFENNFH